MIILFKGSVIWTIILVLQLSIVTKCEYYDEDYRSVEDVDDDDSESYQENETKRKDYTKYYSNEKPAPVASGSSQSIRQEESNGFVTPLDFTGLFTDTHFGLGLGASNINNIVRSPNSSPAFGLVQEASASTNNHSGFVTPNEFKSIFNVASLTSDIGFRPKDFLASESVGENTKLPNFFLSPLRTETNNAPKAYPSKINIKTGPNYSSITIKPPTDQYKKLPTNYKKSVQNQRPNGPGKQNGQQNEEYIIDYSSPTIRTESNPQKNDYDTPKSDEAYSTTSFSSGLTSTTKEPHTVEPHSGKTAYPTSPSYQALSPKTQYYPLPSIRNNIKYLPNTITPYEKYSFQPSNYYQTVESKQLPTQKLFNGFPIPTTAASLLASASGKDTEKLINKNCRRIEKQSQNNSNKDRLRRQATICFLCKDPKSNDSYEQCSYASEPNEYLVNEKYSTGSEFNPIISTRHKRHARKPKNKHYGSEEDPYDYNAKSYRYKSQPPEFQASASYKAPDFKEFDYDPKEDETYDDPNYYSFDPIIESHSNQQAEQLQKEGANCKKVERDSMTCMVCDHPKTGGNFEQCSYTSKPNEKKYAFTKERKYDSNDDDSDDDDSDEQEGTEVKPSYTNKKSASNKHSRKPHSDKEICEDVKKKNLLCKVCKNVKTGAKSETCSYKSQPAEKEYTYRNKQSYRGKPRTSEDEDTQQSQYQPRVTKSKRNSYSDGGFKIPEHFEKDIKEREDKIKPGIIGLDPDLYGSPDEFKGKTVDEDKEDEKEDEKEDDEEDSTSDKKEESSKNTETHVEEPSSSLNYDEYFAKIFPEYSTVSKSEVGDDGSASQKNEDFYEYKDPDKFFGESSRKDVEQVLAEFVKKDRSNCKKVIRDKLTCYLCIDKKGMKNEECMYVAESQPKSTHMAYHQEQKYKSPKKKQFKKLDTSASQHVASNITDSNDKTEEIKTTQKRKHKKATSVDNTEPVTFAPISDSLKKSNTSRILKRSTSENDPMYFASNAHYTYEKPPFNEPKHAESRKKQRKVTKPPADADEPDIPKPAEFEVEGSDGAFASELRPVYSKRLGVTLPAFMLTKSEHEASFDEAVASG